MRVIEFLDKINKFGYNDDTELTFYFLSPNEKQYNVKIEEIENVDRTYGVDNLGVLFDIPKEYVSDEMADLRINLKRSMLEIINKI